MGLDPGGTIGSADPCDDASRGEEMTRGSDGALLSRWGNLVRAVGARCNKRGAWGRTSILRATRVVVAAVVACGCRSGVPGGVATGVAGAGGMATFAITAPTSGEGTPIAPPSANAGGAKTRLARARTAVRSASCDRSWGDPFPILLSPLRASLSLLQMYPALAKDKPRGQTIPRSRDGSFTRFRALRCL